MNKFDPDDLVLWYIFLAFTAVSIFVLYCAKCAVFSDGKVDYCYIVSAMPEGKKITFLYGHRPWRTDICIGKYDDLESAISDATKISCPLEASPSQ